MKFVDEYRDGAAAKKVADLIRCICVTPLKTVDRFFAELRLEARS